jgi:hypothetical protein
MTCRAGAATGGNFSAGAVRLSIHYELFSLPTS